MYWWSIDLFLIDWIFDYVWWAVNYDLSFYILRILAFFLNIGWCKKYAHKVFKVIMGEFLWISLIIYLFAKTWI
jgi:hypothetical protein